LQFNINDWPEWYFFHWSCRYSGALRWV